MAKHVMQGLSPIQYDRWWRDRIQKEQGLPELGPPTPINTSMHLNAIGTPAEITHSGTMHHLRGTGALVTRQLQESASPSQDLAAVRAASKDLEARMARKKAQTRGPGSEAGSQHSYPATPSFSQASGSVANSQVQSRLAQLEEDLARERMRRELAQQEMQQLMQLTAGRPVF
ncbi:hypothetical protein V8C86DRAFT_2655979 [Haematococcus lacustris]